MSVRTGGRQCHVLMFGLVGVVAAPLGLLGAQDTAALGIITVSTTADDYTVNGNCTLREAIASANLDDSIDACAQGNGADQIILPTGNYTLSIPGTDDDADLTGDLDVLHDLTIVGNGSTIDAQRIDRVLQVAELAIVTIKNTTIRGGYFVANNAQNASGSRFMGGGIYNDGTITLEDSTVTGNSGDIGAVGPFVGAGIANQGNLTLLRTQVVGNSIGHLYPAGGAGGIANNGILWITQSTISGNTSWDGGGGLTNSNTVTITDSTISGNRTGCYECDSRGGGIYNGANMTISNSTISSNVIDAGDYAGFASGGGLFSGGTLKLVNVTIANNNVTHLCDTHCFAVPSGGGISAGTPVTTLNTIISGNTVTENQSAPNGGGSVTTPWDCDGTVTSRGYTLVQTTAGCAYTSAVGDLVGVDPLLGTLRGNGGPTLTHNPAPNSPVIDAGSPATPATGGLSCVRADQRGMPRSDDANFDGVKRSDIGAVEAVAIDSTSSRVQFGGTWVTTSNAKSADGSFRTGSIGGTATFDTVGPVFTIITKRGPQYGKARVTVDGVSRGVVDFYSPAVRWLSRQKFSGLGAGPHHVVITVLSIRNAASIGNMVVFDAVTLR